MRKSHIWTLAVAAFAVALAVFYYRSGEKKKPVRIDPGFSRYISAFTGGVISNEAKIRIRLASDCKEWGGENNPVGKKIFNFSPSIGGDAYWVDAQTIEFRPAQKLPSGRQYLATFYLSQLLKVPGEFKNFQFNFQTIIQAFEVNITGLKTIRKTELQWQRLFGNIITADVADFSFAEKILSAEQDGKNLKIQWEHEADGKSHRFTVDSINRMETPGKVILGWNGSPVNVSQEGKKEVEIPALGDFKLTSAQVVQTPEQYVSLQFSDPLSEEQNLQGLVSIEDVNDLRTSVEDNEIRVFPGSRQSGSRHVNAEGGIKNILGYKMGNRFSASLLFEEIKPAVRLKGNGIILPSSNGLIFPFEAVNLKAVDVSVTKIFENNISQFLQVNELDGDNEMHRVGKRIFKKTISLISPDIIDYGRWNRFTLDLSELIKSDPGAIYRVNIGFKKKQSLYKCGGEGGENDGNQSLHEIETPAQENWDVPEQSYWDMYEGYYYPDDYDWDERDNPCNTSYYTSQRWVGRNLLASDLGLIAKRGSNGQMVFSVTDIKTTKPVQNAILDIYDYQRQLIKSVQSDYDGLAKVDLNDNPFLLIARKDEQRGYLKLDDGSSLSVSMFDVSGDVVQKGIKGFIYGERGVWRPGDSLYLVFILEDKGRVIPDVHPVIFELANPQGQLVKKSVSNASVGGFYNFATATAPDAPTGNWNATVKVGGASFRKVLKVESIMPNRLKIAMDFGADKLTVNDKSIRGKLEVKWLHGAIAKNLRAVVEVLLAEAPTVFSKFPDFIFDDPARKFSAEPQVIFDGEIDERGNASIQPEISVENASPGILRANFTTRVFEEGGAFSIDRFSIPYYPYERYVGIKLPKGDKARGMLLTDTNHIVKIVTVDDRGNTVPAGKITMEVYKIEWRWWFSKDDDDIGNYINSEYHRPLLIDTVTCNNGTAEWKLRINYPEWGRYLVRASDEEGGHSTGKIIYIDWPGWAGRAQKEGAGATMLSFSADKEKYAVGEEVRLVIPGSEGGRALLTIESGSKILKEYWFETQKGETVFTFPASKEMTPNVYAYVTLLQPHNQTKNDLPIRLYGVIPISVDDPNTHLEPLLSMPDVLHPEDKVDITVREKEGKPMVYTIAMVDDGLLDLTRFKTPDPWSSFYAREALGVKTWDLFDYVIGAYGGELERLFALGGDEEVRPKGGTKAQRFKPMVKFLGPFQLGKRKKNVHRIEIPQYIGSVRTMVIAGYEGAYGSVEKTTPVRKPLMVLATLPRVVGPGETVKLPVSVFAMESFVKNVSVEIIPNAMFETEGPVKKSISFSSPGDEIVDFDIRVKSAIGVGKVKVIAVSGNEKAVSEIELDVRNPNPEVTDVYDAVIEPGQSWTREYTPPGMSGTNSGMLEVSGIPPINLGKRLRYLITYPHGCIEQTTSGAFPQLFLSDIIELTPDMKKKIEENIKMAINRIRTFQVANGGLGYWPNAEADEWGTNYAGHFMIEAEQKGFNMPAGFFDSWKKFQIRKAQSWTGGNQYASDLIQAYRLYTLALAKAPELGAMNRLREQKNLTVAAKWRLAAAYKISGQPEAASALIQNLGTDVKEYSELSYTYGSGIRDEAMILEALSLIGDRAKATPVMMKISAALGNDRWMSTQSTAYCLIAVSKFIGRTGTSHGVEFVYAINNSKEEKRISQAAVVQTDMKIKGFAPGNVYISNQGKGILYVRIILHGTPETGDKTFAENDLKMKVSYMTMKGERLEPAAIVQGTDFMAEVSVSNPGMRGEYKELALTQVFPSGWEIRNMRMEQEGGDKTSPAKYEDIRDDRVYTYFDLAKNETKTFRVLLNAAYLGKYYLPTVSAEAMYDATINARVPGKWVEVVTPVL